MVSSLKKINKKIIKSGSDDENVPSNKYILFYGKKLPYEQFSNFWKCPVIIKAFGMKLKCITSEHAYQIGKAITLKDATKIFKATSPASAKRISKKIKLWKRWEEPYDKNVWKKLGYDKEVKFFDKYMNEKNKNKDFWMLYCVFMKFYQNKDLRKILLKTNNSYLVEHTWRDKYWADSLNGKGLNMLGQILMIVRGILAKDKTKGLREKPKSYIKDIMKK